MKLITISALMACACWTDPAQSFDLHTHVAMTAKAVGKSALGVNPASSGVISRLAIKGFSVICFTTAETPDRVGCGGNWACRQDTPKQLTLTTYWKYTEPDLKHTFGAPQC